jgi:hypothetical protein
MTVNTLLRMPNQGQPEKSVCVSVQAGVTWLSLPPRGLAFSECLNAK